jgi:DNA transposition AAA+ family ATPase
VEGLRADLEAALPPLVKTQDTATVQAAFDAAAIEHRLAVLSGKWRHGKTVECERVWLRNLHRAIWIHCPVSNEKRSFIFALASALGLGVGSGVKPSHLEEKIKRTLAIGLIDTVFIDEAANLWPSDVRQGKPGKAEFVRELRDSLGIGFVLIATDQFALSLELARLHNERWAPGQFFGRQRLFLLRDSHTDAEVRAIAALHAGPLESAASDGLLAFARSHEGYLGSMTSAAARARRAANAERGAGAAITAAEVAAATRAQQTDARIITLAEAITPRLASGRKSQGERRVA